MKTSSKLFGGSHMLHLTAYDEKSDILKHLYNHTKVSLPEKSKTMTLVGNNNMSILKNGYYAMAVPEDLDMYLYFTNYRGHNRCFLICRQLGAGYMQPKILVTFPPCVDSEIYSNAGTLIECTRVRATDNRFFILMTDVQYYKGIKVSQNNVIERLKCLGEFMLHGYKENLKQFPFRLQIATPYEHLNLLEQRLSNLPYKVNRILFVPPYRKTTSLYLKV